MSMYLALDPGLTTGVAYYETADRAGQPSKFSSFECEGRYELYEYLCVRWGFGGSLPYPSCDAVIIERWDVRKNTHQLSNQDDVRYIIGYVDGIVHRTRGVEYVEQRPAEAKSFGTDAKLKKLGWFSGGAGHADDAARHLLVYLAKAKVSDIIERLV